MALPEPIGETFDQVPHPANAAGNLPAEHNNMFKRMEPAEATFALSLQDYLTIVKKDHQASILDVVREMKEKLGQTTNSSLEEQIYDECTDKVMSLLDDQEKNLLLQKTALSVNEDVVRRQEEEKMSLKRRLRRALDCILCFTCLVLVFIGQLIRSLAMVHAADNFSHEVAHHKRPDHRLVTDGIYSYTRHPSYLGFFTWALGTQIGLSNPLSTIIFAVVLWRFFSRRIRGEEIYLVAFFGREYEEYRKRVGVYIPFVR
ncbi:hypothetical protein L7F22_067979 [Adiantum nelumboides]|nr:hypothetical protein [Adiantum nelumboides]